MKNLIRNFVLVLVVCCIAFSVSCGQGKKTDSLPISGDDGEEYCVVTFDFDEKTQVQVKKGEMLDVFSIPFPSKDGYEFVCWLYGGKEIDTSSVINEDITLTPLFEPKDQSAIKLKKYDGAEVNLLPSAMKDYLSLTEESEIAEYLYQYQNAYKQADSSKSVLFSWQTDIKGEYTLYIAQDEKFNDITAVYKTTDKSVDVYNLVPGRYFWKVETENGEISKQTYQALQVGENKIRPYLQVCGYFHRGR